MPQPQQHESLIDVQIARAIMRAIFGTDTRTSRDEERAETDKMLSRAERKVAKLNLVLDHPAKNLDEALQQVVDGPDNGRH